MAVHLSIVEGKRSSKYMLSPQEIVLTSCTQCNKPPAAIHHAFRQATWGITGRDGAGGGGGLQHTFILPQKDVHQRLLRNRQQRAHSISPLFLITYPCLSFLLLLCCLSNLSIILGSLMGGMKEKKHSTLARYRDGAPSTKMLTWPSSSCFIRTLVVRGGSLACWDWSLHGTL